MPPIDNSASIDTRIKLRQAQELDSKKTKKILNGSILYVMSVLMPIVDSTPLLANKPFFDDFYKDSISILTDEIFLKHLLSKIPMYLGSIALYEIAERKFHFSTVKLGLSNKKDYRSPLLLESDAEKEIALLKQNTQNPLGCETIQLAKVFLFFYLIYKVVTTVNSKSMDELLYLLLVVSYFTLTSSGLISKSLVLKTLIDKPKDEKYLSYFSKSISELFMQNSFKQSRYENDIFITLSNSKKIKFFSLILGTNLEKIGFEAIIANEDELVVRYLGAKKTPFQHEQDFQRFKEQTQIALQRSQDVSKNIKCFKKFFYKSFSDIAKNIQFKFSYNCDTGSVTANIIFQIKDSTNLRLKEFFAKFELLESESDQIVLCIKNNSIDWRQEIKNFESNKKELADTSVVTQPKQEEKKTAGSNFEAPETTLTKKIKVKTRPTVAPRPDWMIDLAEDEEVVSTAATKKPACLEIDGGEIAINEKYFKPLINKDGITTIQMLFFHPATRQRVKSTDTPLYKRFKGLWEQPKTCAPQGENGFKKFTEGKKGWEAKLIGVNARIEGEERTATLTYDDGSQSAVVVICFDKFIPKAH